MKFFRYKRENLNSNWNVPHFIEKLHNYLRKYCILNMPYINLASFSKLIFDYLIFMCTFINTFQCKQQYIHIYFAANLQNLPTNLWNIFNIRQKKSQLFFLHLKRENFTQFCYWKTQKKTTIMKTTNWNGNENVEWNKWKNYLALLKSETQKK